MVMVILELLLETLRDMDCLTGHGGDSAGGKAFEGRILRKDIAKLLKHLSHLCRYSDFLFPQHDCIMCRHAACHALKTERPALHGSRQIASGALYWPWLLLPPTGRQRRGSRMSPLESKRWGRLAPSSKNAPSSNALCY